MPIDEPNASSLTRRDFAASVLGAAASLALPRSLADRAAPASADYTLQSDVMVSMRDGVRLATDVYRPDDRR